MNRHILPENLFDFPGTAFGTWVPRNMDAHLTLYAGVPATQLKSGGSAAVVAVLNDEKKSRSNTYEAEWNGMWHFCNIMQFSDEFIAVAATGLDRMDYLALPVTKETESVEDVSETENEKEAWKSILELLFDEESRTFANTARDKGVPAPDEGDVGLELEGADGEVAATIELGWPDRKIGFMTTEQLPDRERAQSMGWKILSAADAGEWIQLFDEGENE